MSLRNPERTHSCPGQSPVLGMCHNRREKKCILSVVRACVAVNGCVVRQARSDNILCQQMMIAVAFLCVSGNLPQHET